MISVRISALSGLHIGATWSFSQGEFSVGGSAACSVFICDEDFPEVFLKMKIRGRRVLIDESSSVEIGETGSDANCRWLFPDQKVFVEHEGVKFCIEVLDTSGKMLAKVTNIIRRTMFQTVESVRGIGVSLILGLSLVLGMSSTVIILFLGTSNVSSLEAKTNEKLAEEQRKAEVVNNQILLAIQAEMNAFAKAQSLDNFKLITAQKDVSVEGKMSRRSLSQFEELLTKLARDYGGSVRLKAQVELTNEQKVVDSVQVRSISLGDQPVVILRSGQKLFLGSFYENLRLVEITEDKIVFVGQSSYELYL